MQQNWNIDFGFLMALGALQGHCPVDNARKVGECFFLLFLLSAARAKGCNFGVKWCKGICRSLAKLTSSIAHKF